LTGSAEAFAFRLEATEGAGRIGTLSTPHGPVDTPQFMPVGTLGAVKTLAPWEVAEAGASMVLANTYHLYLRPGHEEVRALGGLHRFMRWDGPLLTDSGGYQVFSLEGIREIRDDGVEFRSHIDGSSHLFTPERVMEIQRSLGADVVMAFDECPPGGCSREVAERANLRTLEWLERCRVRFESLRQENHGPEQALFPVLQGNVYPDLRREHARQVRAAGDWRGYAIGGLSVGEPKPRMWATLEVLHPELPHDLPRYLMGVGYPDDLLEAIGRGCDLFDCVAPTRNARHGTAWTAHEGQVNLKAARFRLDRNPLDPECDGPCCTRFDRAYLRHLSVAGEAFAHRLLSFHNVRFLIRLAEESRRRIRAGTFASWSRDWLERYRSARV
jgi:queuine tRNA-ribosyltransferase